jgi:nickel-dependent lactate racemase
MSREDIERNHAHAMSPDAAGMRLRGNPVFDDIADVIRRLEEVGKDICSFSQVIRGDIVVAASAGPPLDTVDALLPTARELYVRPIPRAADVLNLKVPLPLGRNLYQADKALKNNHLAVRDGGGIVLESDCAEGIGPDAFFTLLRRAGDWATARQIVEEEGYRLSDHKAVKLRHLTDPAGRGVHVALVSSHIERADAEAAGMSLFLDVPQALGWLAGVIDGSVERGLIVEDAGLVTTVVGVT